jgi:tetratricopeptide (TPR) repeat protein
LRTLPGDLADAVARLLVATGLEEDPEGAYQYALSARKLAARVGIVRETCAIAAYQAGRWADALAEFRAARRLTGRSTYLPLMADCERGLGRLDKALEIVTGPDAKAADRATQVELRIVESGIRRDQGLPDAAVVALQIPELTQKRGRAGHARLFYAYADALLEAGREEEARDWFGQAAAADTAGETDAAERLDELDEVLIEDLADWDDEDGAVEEDSAVDEDRTVEGETDADGAETRPETGPKLDTAQDEATGPAANAVDDSLDDATDEDLGGIDLGAGDLADDEDALDDPDQDDEDDLDDADDDAADEAGDGPAPTADVPEHD